jgi:hypothetical protein
MNSPILIQLLLVCACMALADRPDPRTSVVGHNAMPKNIVQRENQWNFGPGSLWTHRGWQYAAYWDDACQVSVARRQLPSGEWSVISLPGYQRTATINRGNGGPKARGFGDGHEKVSMGISPDGVIHLAFDHHCSTLHYRTSKSGVANNPQAHSWTAELFGPVQDHLGGPTLDLVTYPSFTLDEDRFVLYVRMGGGSGSGNSHFFEYENGQWTINDELSSKLIDKNWSGGNKTVNAYPQAMVVHNGRRHLTWCWRDTPDSKTCHDLCYAYSDDHGRTWHNNDGKKIARLGERFITADTPGIAVWDIPPGKKYINGGSLAVDSSDRVHVLVRGEDGSPTHFTRDPDTGAWRREKFPESGTLIAGSNNELFLVSEDGLKRTISGNFRKIKTITTAPAEKFVDSKMSVDHTRLKQDGWISVIGQQGKTITVIDYQIKK